MDHGPGLLRAFLNQLGTLLKGVGRRARAVVRRSRTLVDGLIEAGVGDNLFWRYRMAMGSEYERNFYQSE